MPNPYEFVKYSLGKRGGGGRLEELTFKILKHFYFIAVYTVQMLIKNCNSAGGLLPTDVFLTVHRQRCQDLVV